METVGLRKPSGAQIESLEKKTIEQVKLFLSLRLEGYQKKNVTPYIHLMVKHISNQMRLLHGIKPLVVKVCVTSFIPHYNKNIKLQGIMMLPVETTFLAITIQEHN